MDFPNYTLIEIEIHSHPDDFDDRAELEAYRDFFRDVASVGGSPALAQEQPPEPVSERDPLSKAHISPHVEYRAGGSLLRASVGGVQPEQVGGGKRGQIVTFSDDSRRRLMYLIAGVKRDASLPLFITLTYPESFPDPKTSKRHLDSFFKRFQRAYPGHGTVWKLEPQQRGAPHFHLMVWGCDESRLRMFVPQAWYDIAGGGDYKHLMWHCGALGNGNVPCVQQVNSFRGVMSYASKYLGKTFEVSGWTEQWTGRFWGVINRDNVPLGELIQEEVTQKKAQEFIRYQRRFSGFKKFRSNKSLTTFCDADQWIEKVLNSARTLTDK